MLTPLESDYVLTLADEYKVSTRQKVTERRAQVRELRDGGVAVRKIAERLQVSLATVVRDIAALGEEEHAEGGDSRQRGGHEVGLAQLAEVTRERDQLGQQLTAANRRIDQLQLARSTPPARAEVIGTPAQTPLSRPAVTTQPEPAQPEPAQPEELLTSEQFEHEDELADDDWQPAG